MKVRVYKTPTASNPTKVAVSIPQAVQENPAISELTLTQEEVLPPPSQLSDLFVEPQTINNLPVNASKSVAETNLTPGFQMVVRPIGLVDELVEPLQVEEVVIPEGYVHLDDESDWNVYNYGKSWTLTDRNFDVLPGEKRLPRQLIFQVVVNETRFSAKFASPIDSVRIYYRRITPIESDFEWVDWTTLTDEPADFPYYGRYVFRAVPLHQGKPLPVYKEWVYEREEPDTLSWSAIQLSADSFQIRMEGVLGPKITEVEAFENGISLGIFRLRPNPNGRTEKTFVINGVSDAQTPEIEYRFMRKVRHHRSLVEKSFHRLQRNYATPPFFMKMKQEGSNFIMNIQDPEGVLYSPVNPLQPFSSQEWQTGIQKQKVIAFLEIIRHQDGETRQYGRYMCNITKETDPRFLESPPFKTKVRRVNKGFEFEFEDTPEFRDIVNLDNPDLDKRLAYEFRIVHWTAGIQECLTSGTDYNFIKETPVLIRNRRSSYKFSYSVWKEEHPRRQWTGVIPVDVSDQNLLHHVRYGRSPQGFVFDSFPKPVEKTRNVVVEEGEWKVLYYYNDKTDELVEHPYYSFDILVPTSSQSLIDTIDVYIEKSMNPISLGSYHPSDTISIVDFIGYYEELKITTQRTNFQRALSAVPSVKKATNTAMNPSMATNTPQKRISVASANRQINNAVVRKVESGTIRYKLVINYIDGQKKTIPLSVSIAERPSIPEESPDNVAFAPGNKTVLPSTFQVPVSAVNTITAEIEQTTIPLKTTTKIGVLR